MSILDEARECASAILASTDLLDELGLTGLAADSRALARLTLEIADSHDAEQSARRAMQDARDRCLAILERQAGEALNAAVTP